MTFLTQTMQALTVLQWGHLSLEVVIFDGDVGIGGSEWLQWGHLSLEVVMGCLKPSKPDNSGRLQWGHLSLEVVIPTARVYASPQTGFNGATSL